MMAEFHREIVFESVSNFRDIGGYRTRDGYTVAWRRLFRSGELCNISRCDFDKLRGEIGIASVIDLRSDFEVKRRGVGLIGESNIKYYNVSFIPDGGEEKANERRYEKFTNMGEFYIDLVGQKGFGRRIVEALEIISEPRNHPLVFHCAAGKDRTGILAAALLSILGVTDKEIKSDYCLSGPYIAEVIRRFKSQSTMPDDLKNLPDFFWEATPESIAQLLDALRNEYSSVLGYLEAQGASSSLFNRLKTILLH